MPGLAAFRNVCGHRSSELEGSPNACCAVSAEALFDVDDDIVAVRLADRLADGSGDGKLVRPVAERHERAAEGYAVDRAGDLDETTGAEHRGGVGHLNAGPRVALPHSPQ